MRKILTWIVLINLAVLPAAQANEKNEYEGFFWDGGKTAIVQLSLTEDSIEGRTVWSEKSKNKRDIKNPDEKLQDRPIVGMVFLSGFEYATANGRWNNGTVYDPNNGKTYDARLSLQNEGESLEMRGYIGLSIFGRTVNFERVSQENTPSGLYDRLMRDLTAKKIETKAP